MGDENAINLADFERLMDKLANIEYLLTVIASAAKPGGAWVLDRPIPRSMSGAAGRAEGG